MCVLREFLTGVAHRAGVLELTAALQWGKLPTRALPLASQRVVSAADALQSQVIVGKAALGMASGYGQICACMQVLCGPTLQAHCCTRAMCFYKLLFEAYAFLATGHHRR